MGVATLLRTVPHVNYFRYIMIRTIAHGYGNAIILCSGFFQENHANRCYQISQEEGFIDAIKQSQVQVTTIGVHNNVWKPAYLNFVNTFRRQGINITAYITSKLRWHAKVFILKRDGIPVFGIVGSSNMTRNAFGYTVPFNYEADTFLWVSDDCGNIVRDYVKEQDTPEDAIFTRYDEEDNSGITIRQRLEYLEQEIFSNELRLVQ